MRILITNTLLAGRSGTEIFAAQLAEEFLRRGEEPMLYAPRIGPLGIALRHAGIPVFERVAEIAPAPDVIHAHHVGPTLAALAAFPGVPAVFVAHGAGWMQDRPPAHPQIRAVFAVSPAVRDQQAHAGWPAERIGILRNAVDLARFPRRPPLPPAPRRALVVAKLAAGVGRVLSALARAGIPAHAIGPGVGQEVGDLPAHFAEADLVLASGRSALEAAATGCAVVLAEGDRLGGPLRPERLEALLDGNLGLRTLRPGFSDADLDAAIAAYDPAAAASVAETLRATVSLSAQAERLLDAYRAAIARGVPRGIPPRDLAALIEAHVPSHGDGPWRALAAEVANDSLTASLAMLAAVSRATLPADDAASLDHQGRIADPAARISWLENELAALRAARGDTP